MADETNEILNEGADAAPPRRRRRKSGETTLAEVFRDEGDGEAEREGSAKAMGWDVVWHGVVDPRELVMREDLQGRHYDDDVSDMVLSLLEDGQKSPICVRRRQDEEGKLEVIFGNRRVRAGLEILQAGLRDKFELRYELVEVGDERAYLANVAENNTRMELTDIDYAHIILRLKSYNRTQIEIAKRLNRSTAWVSKTISLLKLSEEEQRMVHLYATSGGKEGIAPATAYELVEKGGQERSQEIERVLSQSKTGRVTRSAVRKQRRSRHEEVTPKQRTASEIRAPFENIVKRAMLDTKREEMTVFESVCSCLVDFCRGVIGERTLMNALETYLAGKAPTRSKTTERTTPPPLSQRRKGRMAAKGTKSHRTPKGRGRPVST